MRRLLFVGVALTLSLALAVSFAVAARAVDCPAGTQAALIGGNPVCLKLGMSCVARYDAQYRKYGFACSSGRLRRSVSLWRVRVLGEGAAEAVNGRGQVIVRGLGMHANQYLWQNGRTIDFTGGSEVIARAINERGQVVGSSTAGGFLWRSGKLTSLGTLSPMAINERGEVVGSARTVSGADHAFLWQSGKVTGLGTLKGGRSSVAVAINEHGMVVGSSHVTVGSGSSAFVWQDGHMTGLGRLPGWTDVMPVAINERGQIVGQATNARGKSRVFLWEKGRMRDLGTLGGSSSFTVTFGTPGSGGAINDRGQIVGSSETKRGARHAFLWERGKMRDLGTLGFESQESEANAINSRGQIVGWSVTPTGQAHAFLWQHGQMTDLGTSPGSGRGEANAINNQGQVVGWSGTDTGAPDKAVLWTLRSN